MRRLPLYQIDAFTSDVFRGNPAAVVPLEAWLPDATLQAMALENNLSETAYFVAAADGTYHLRWFTPTTEVDLCGHATLAAAYVIMRYVDASAEVVRFTTQSAGELVVRQTGPEGDRLALDFPARPPELVRDAAVLRAVADALGVAPAALWKARDLMAVLDGAAAVAGLRPDMAKIAALPAFALIVTAAGEGEVDFVSRFFAPAKGVPEDPVTGSAHCTLIPYWSAKLGKKALRARQVSPRGGELWCEDRGGRVTIAGHAVRYLEGFVYLPGGANQENA